VLRFHLSLLRRALSILVGAGDRYLTGASIVTLAATLLNPELGQVVAGLLGGTWVAFSRWWALVPLGFLVILFIYGLMQANFEAFQKIESEKEALERQTATAERYRAFRNLLGAAIYEGVLLRQSMLKPLQEWVDRTGAFIEDALGKAAALRFLDNSGYRRKDLEYDYATEETWLELRYERYVREFRVRRLRELEQSVKPEDLNPHFNPQDYKGYFRTKVEGT
jgi:hypothetical protein